MPINAIQFQKGFSQIDFFDRYGTEAACEATLEKSRWPNGFVCPRCGAREYSRFVRDGQKLWQCSACRKQTSLRAGTLFAHSRLSLRHWFLAMYYMTQQKNNVSALELKRLLGVNYKAAWRIKHKLMQAMHERESERQLVGLIQIDDAYLGGERSGRPGRGSPNKIPFVAAVQLNEDGHPIYIKLNQVPNFGSYHITQWGEKALASDCHIVSDGLNCFQALASSPREQTRIVSGGGRASVQEPRLRWVNTLLGNLKTAINGTYHAFKFAKYSRRYLAEYAYRFNRRFHLPSMVPRLAYLAIHTAPWPERKLRVAEVWG